MPNLDGTGPNGQGPRTGRGMGRGWRCCGGYRCRRSLGFGRFFSRKNNLATLEEQEKMLVEELNAIREEKASLANGGK
jgi:hypothetical protein